MKNKWLFLKTLVDKYLCKVFNTLVNKMPSLKNLIFAAVFTLLISHPALALWATQETGTAQNINALYFINGADGYAVGDSGTVLKTANSGTTWEAKTTGDTGNYNNVFFPSLTEGYILSAGGKVFKTVDGAASFTDISSSFSGLPAGVVFKKGSYFGVYRAIVGTDNTDSYLLTSTDSGASWTTETISGVVANGVFLTAADEVWVWGTKGGDGIILKNGATTLTASLQPINDLYFIDTSVGYAAGDNGYYYKTINGGSYWQPTQISAVADKKLKAVYFYNENLGWLVGEGGNVLITGSGGTTWTSYPVSGDVAATDTFNDISIYSSGSGPQTSVVGASVGACNVMLANGTSISIFAYLAGNSGKILKLSSPTVTGITPAAKMQGWVGSVEVTGTGFLSGAAVQFVKTGSPEIFPVTYTYPSSTKIVAYIVADRNTDTATINTYDIKVTNPDATFDTLAGAFTLNPYTAKIFFRNVWLELHMVSSEVTADGMANPANTAPDGTPGRFNITTQPTISYEVSSTGTIEPNTMKAKLLTRLTTADATGGTTYIYSEIPSTSIEVVATNEVHIYYTIPSAEALPAWAKGTDASFILYGEDALGNIGMGKVFVSVAEDLLPGSTYTAPLGARVGDPCYTGTIRSIVDRKVGTTAFIRIPDKIQINDFDVRLVGQDGQEIDKTMKVRGGKLTDSGVRTMRVKTAVVAGQGVVTQYTWTIPPAVFTNIPAGMYLIYVTDINGQELAKNKMMVWTNK
ncbi:MAG: YCF48-related protein [bacterium]